jgi:hypothetical protein
MKYIEILEQMMYTGEHEILSQGFAAIQLAMKVTENNMDNELLNDLENV